MTTEPGSDRALRAEREIVLQGAGLVVAVGVVLALLAGAFALGRWYEGRTGARPSAETGPPGRLEFEPARTRDLDERADAFDDAGQLEPRREAREGASGSAQTGEYFVQVFAGRSREAAERVVAQLAERGHPARLESAADGRDELFRVQVGGFDDRQTADRAVETLRREGFRGAFVARAR